MGKLATGIVMLLIGAGVTIYSYVVAPVGGHFVVMTGLLIGGAVLTIRGIIELAREGKHGPAIAGSTPAPANYEPRPYTPEAAHEVPAMRAVREEPAIPVLNADTSYLMNKPAAELSPHEAIAQRRAQRLAAEQQGK